MRPQSAKGFTLVEVMMVVAIIGILAAVAIPAFTRYVKKARTAEAPAQLHRMWAGAVTYYQTDFTNIEGMVLPKQFPGPIAEWEQPDSHCCHSPHGMCLGGNPIWSTSAIWSALKFSMPDPHRYMPGYTGLRDGKDATFTAVSIGDLNCDDNWSYFSRQGFVSSTGDVGGQAIPTIVNELE